MPHNNSTARHPRLHGTICTGSANDTAQSHCQYPRGIPANCHVPCARACLKWGFRGKKKSFRSLSAGARRMVPSNGSLETELYPTPTWSQPRYRPLNMFPAMHASRMHDAREVGCRLCLGSGRSSFRCRSVHFGLEMLSCFACCFPDAWLHQHVTDHHPCGW